MRLLSTRGATFATIAILGTSILSTAILASTPAAAASGIQIFVGYADSLRANAVSFPTPWQGSPNTIFEGCTPPSGCTYDGGAVQVFNGTNNSVHVDSIAVTVGTCVFGGWSPSTLPSGDSLIITQLQSGSNDGCVRNSPADLMDTSDVGPNGTAYAGNCTQDHLIPTVDVTIDGTSTPYTDTGQVLNTGGFDGACVGNESTQWTIIGNPPCHSSGLTLAPASQTHPVFTTATVTATFSACGQPLANAAVDFSITVGPNAGKTLSAPTNAAGQAPFPYSSTQVGTDTVAGSISNLAGSINATPVAVIWTAPFAKGGAFVIGDRENVLDNPAYWWGAQWWKFNPLSTGLATASFKGFENSNATPWCGDTWTARPGNSSRPPRSVPPYMAVVVSSQITKLGPTISGDIVAIVVVKTDAGYRPNPGHRGTGTIVATLCSTTAAASATPPLPVSHGNGTGSGQETPAATSELTPPSRPSLTAPSSTVAPATASGRKSDPTPHKPRSKHGR